MYTQFSFLLLSPCCFLLRIQFLCLRLTMKYFLPYTHTGYTQIIKVYEIRLNRKQNWDTEKNKQEKNRWFFFHSFHFMLLNFVCYQNQHKIPKMSTVHVVVTIFFFQINISHCSLVFGQRSNDINSSKNNPFIFSLCRKVKELTKHFL